MKKSCANCRYSDIRGKSNNEIMADSVEHCCNCIHKGGWAPREPETSHPDYYRKGGIECFAAIDSATSGLQGADAFDTGNAIKYLWCWKEKNGVEDLKKAVTYIQRIIERDENHAN